jgi:phosphotransferase system enzyme I (PtsI)
MFPMVAFVEELRQARRLLEDCRAELAGEGVALGPMQVGIMVETPAAALIAASLAEEADFFSLGTNDLIQYTLAADRTNERVGALYQPLHPAVLALIEAVARAARARGRWVGVCGEMGSMLEAVPLLVGLGVTELSVTPGTVPAVKARVQSLERAAAAEVARRALGCATPAEVQELVTSLAA